MASFKKLMIACLVGTLVQLPLANMGFAADTPKESESAKVTDNKPILSGTAEENLPGSAKTGTAKPSRRNMLWIGAAAVVVVGLALGLSGSGGGGGSGGENPPSDQEKGGVEVEW